MNSKARKRLVVATVLLVVAFAAAVVWIVRSQGAYYRQVGELTTALDGEVVKVGGTVLSGADPGAARTLFAMRDLSGGDQTVQVAYSGQTPDTFGPGVDVVVVGTYDAAAGVIRAEELQTKCPSRYEASRSPAP